jgi:hypothetical protein
MDAVKSYHLTMLLISCCLSGCVGSTKQSANADLGLDARLSKTPYSDLLKRDERETFSSSTGEGTERLQFAISGFFGFYLINTDIRLNYCRELGVDISLFVTAFTHANQDVYDKAKLLGATYDVSENRVLFKLEPSLADMISKSMAEQAEAAGTTTAELCERIRYNPEVMASGLVFSRSKPDIYKLLMDTH